jgi:peptidyl-prolyl cis-trans isomerase A (cyclophilin A)
MKFKNYTTPSRSEEFRQIAFSSKRFITSIALTMGIAAILTFPSQAEKPEPAPAAPPVEATTVKVRLKTNQGDILLLLDRAKAPITVDNFRSYVEKKHYDGTVFHRIIDGFMIQGGGFSLSDDKLVEKSAGAGIKNEGTNGLKNLRGTIAMARTPDPDSARAQFFINVVDNPALDYPSNGGYAVFGKVIEGMDVVDKIKSVPTKPGDVPTIPIVIETAVILPSGS